MDCGTENIPMWMQSSIAWHCGYMTNRTYVKIE